MEIIWVKAEADAIYLYLTTSYIKHLSLEAVYKSCIQQLYLAANYNKALPVEPSSEVALQLESIYKTTKDEIYRIFDLLHYILSSPTPFTITKCLYTNIPQSAAHSVHSHSINIDLQSDILFTAKAVNPFIVSLYTYQGLMKKLDEFIAKYKDKKITRLVKEVCQRIETNQCYETNAEAKHMLIEELLHIICTIKTPQKIQKLFGGDNSSAITELTLLIDQSSVFFSRIPAIMSEQFEFICREYHITDSEIEAIKKLYQKEQFSTLRGQPVEAEIIYQKIYEQEQKQSYEPIKLKSYNM